MTQFFWVHLLECVFGIVFCVVEIGVDARIIILMSFSVLASACLFHLHPSMLVRVTVAKMIRLSDDKEFKPSMISREDAKEALKYREKSRLRNSRIP